MRQNLAPLVAALIRQGAISLTSQSDPFDCLPATFIAAVHSTSLGKASLLQVTNFSVITLKNYPHPLKNICRIYELKFILE